MTSKTPAQMLALTVCLRWHTASAGAEARCLKYRRSRTMKHSTGNSSRLAM